MESKRGKSNPMIHLSKFASKRKIFSGVRLFKIIPSIMILVSCIT